MIALRGLSGISESGIIFSYYVFVRVELPENVEYSGIKSILYFQ